MTTPSVAVRVSCKDYQTAGRGGKGKPVIVNATLTGRRDQLRGNTIKGFHGGPVQRMFRLSLAAQLFARPSRSILEAPAMNSTGESFAAATGSPQGRAS
jgi:hypothetical protein